MVLSSQIGQYGSEQATFSSDGALLVSAGMSGDIAVWDTKTWAKLFEFNLEDGLRWCLGSIFLPETKVVLSVWANGRLHRHDCETGTSASPSVELGNLENIICVAWLLDQKYLVCGDLQGMMQCFSIDTGKSIGHPIQAHSDNLTSLSTSFDGLMIASTSRDQSFKTWTISSEQLTGPVTIWNHSNAIYGGAFSPVDSSLFSFADLEFVQVVNLKTKTIQYKIHETGVFTAAYSPNGQYLAFDDRLSHSLQLHKGLDQRIDQETKERSPPTKLKTGHGDSITLIVFSPDFQHVVTRSNYDSTLRVHDLADASMSHLAKGHQGYVASIAFSQDGKTLISAGSDNSICIWDLTTGTLVKGPIKTDRDVTGMALAPDGMTIACGHNYNSVRFWSTDSHKKIGPTLSLKPSKGHSQLTNIEFSPKNSTLAVTFSEHSTLDPSAFLQIYGISDSADIPAVNILIEMSLSSSEMSYHPTGDYICCGNQAWKLSPEPSACGSDSLQTILDETFPGFLQYDRKALPFPAIMLGSRTRQTFYLPPNFDAHNYSINGTLIALGSSDGQVMVLDFKHLLKPDEVSLLSRISKY